MMDVKIYYGVIIYVVNFFSEMFIYIKCKIKKYREFLILSISV